MSTIPKAPAQNRRALLSRALAGAAGATIAASAGHAALPGAVDDPVLDLIAEASRWDRLGGDARERADEVWFAARDELQRSSGVEEVDLPAPFGALYAEAKRCDDAEQELFDRIVATRPTTIEGAAAKLLLLIIDQQDEGSRREVGGNCRWRSSPAVRLPAQAARSSNCSTGAT